jgi:hypothetical protein
MDAMRKRILLLAATSAMLATSAAIASPPDSVPPEDFSARACLRYDQIWNWKALDQRTLIVEDNFHKKFKVELLGYCGNLTFKEQLAFRSPGGTQLSCVSPGDTVISREIGTGQLRCPVRRVITYTPEMERADALAKEQKRAEPDH